MINILTCQRCLFMRCFEASYPCNCYCHMWAGVYDTEPDPDGRAIRRFVIETLTKELGQ